MNNLILKISYGNFETVNLESYRHSSLQFVFWLFTNVAIFWIQWKVVGFLGKISTPCILALAYILRVDYCFHVSSSNGRVYYLTFKWRLRPSALFHRISIIHMTTLMSRKINILCNIKITRHQFYLQFKMCVFRVFLADFSVIFGHLWLANNAFI